MKSNLTLTYSVLTWHNLIKEIKTELYNLTISNEINLDFKEFFL